MGNTCSYDRKCKGNYAKYPNYYSQSQTSENRPNIFKRLSGRYASERNIDLDSLPMVTSLDENENDVLRYEREFSPTNVYFTTPEKSMLEKLYPQRPFRKPLGYIKHRKYKEIAQGTAGVVWEAFDIEKGNIIAVKTIYSDKEKIDVFKREADIMAQLSHKNIVKFLGSKVFRKENKLEIYMELIDGWTLKQLLHQHIHLMEDVTACYTAQILAALEFVHARELIHLDIKSLNVLIDKNGVAKLTDFGSYIHLSEPRTPSVGTIFWMAPEVLTSTHYERWADIWSLGCVVYEMLVGESPFK